MFRTPTDMDWAMLQPGTSQIHGAATPTMHMAPPMVVSIWAIYFNRPRSIV